MKAVYFNKFLVCWRGKSRLGKTVEAKGPGACVLWASAVRALQERSECSFGGSQIVSSANGIRHFSLYVLTSCRHCLSCLCYLSPNYKP